MGSRWPTGGWGQEGLSSGHELESLLTFFPTKKQEFQENRKLLLIRKQILRSVEWAVTTTLILQGMQLNLGTLPSSDSVCTIVTLVWLMKFEKEHVALRQSGVAAELLGRLGEGTPLSFRLAWATDYRVKCHCYTSFCFSIGGTCW